MGQKVLVAMDSFKESLTTMQAGNAVKEGVLSVWPDADILALPMADGGEGTLDALIVGLGGEKVPVTVCGPLGDRVDASYGVIEHRGYAVIEIVQAVGLNLVQPADRGPLLTTTYGVGEMILDAMDRGYQNIMVGLGGSATNDAGLGMLGALGFKFLDGAGKPVGICGQDVGKVRAIDVSQADKRLRDCRFTIACDVRNPLCGENGATAVYGPQKGATPDVIEALDRELRGYSQITASVLGKDLSGEPGAGAAGGLGFAFLAFLNAEMQPGVEVVMDAIALETAIVGADFVVTGEGKLDAQTVMGKVPIGVAQRAKKHGAIVIAFSGCAEDDAETCNDFGIDAYFPIISMPQSAQEVMESQTAEKNLKTAVKQVFRLIDAVAQKC